MTAGQIAPEVLDLASSTMDEGVDGLEPQGPQAALMCLASGNLFGRPSFLWTIANKALSPPTPQFLTLYLAVGGR